MRPCRRVCVLPLNFYNNFVDDLRFKICLYHHNAHLWVCYLEHVCNTRVTPLESIMFDGFTCIRTCHCNLFRNRSETPILLPMNWLKVWWVNHYIMCTSITSSGIGQKHHSYCPWSDYCPWIDYSFQLVDHYIKQHVKCYYNFVRNRPVLLQ